MVVVVCYSRFPRPELSGGTRTGLETVVDKIQPPFELSCVILTWTSKDGCEQQAWGAKQRGSALVRQSSRRAAPHDADADGRPNQGVKLENPSGKISFLAVLVELEGDHIGVLAVMYSLPLTPSPSPLPRSLLLALKRGAFSLFLRFTSLR